MNMKKIITLIAGLVFIFQGADLLAQYGNPTNYDWDVRYQKTTNVGQFRMTLAHSSMTGSGILKDRNTHYITFHGNDDWGRHHIAFHSRASLLGFGCSNWADQGKIVLPGIPEGVTTTLYTKYPHQTLTIDVADKSLDPVYDEVKSDLISDQMILQTFTTDMGLDVTVRAYVWGEPNYDEFAIVHYEVVNTTGQELQDFIFTQFGAGRPGDAVNTRHDKGMTSFLVNFYGANTGDSLKIVYWQDYDDPKNAKDDESNPHTDTGEFLTTEYWGWGLIHADKSSSDRSNDVANQPTTTYRTAQLILGATEDGPFYDMATTGNHMPFIGPDDGYDTNVNQDYIGGLTIGPYSSFPVGDTLNFVLFGGMGIHSIPEAKDMGAKWLNGQISKAEKNTWLRSAKDKLFANMSKAIRVWENGLQLTEGQTPAPPSSTTLTPGGGQATIEWEPVAGNVSYDIYRTCIEEELLPGGDTRLRYIYDDPVVEDLTSTEYVDTGLRRGETYYYYVVAKDNSTGLQSSHYYLRNVNGVTIYASPTKTLETVRVVPNPYNISKPAFTQEDRVIFAGLPGPCKIRIYTESGDLVSEIDHPFDRGIAEWDQVTQFAQRIQSGIYIYHVESMEGLGEKIGKFVVIR
jgi:hypothetical protein